MVIQGTFQISRPFLLNGFGGLHIYIIFPAVYIEKIRVLWNRRTVSNTSLSSEYGNTDKLKSAI